MKAWLGKLLCGVTLCSALQFGASGGGAQSAPISGAFSGNTTVGQILAEPNFKGFARYLLPLEWRFDQNLQLNEVAELLPYHNYVDPQLAVTILNELKIRAQQGEQVFYPLAKPGTGVFYFPGKPGAPTAIIAAGGGFIYVGSIHEGFPYARYLNGLGYNALVVHYRTGDMQAACEDMAAAVGFMFEHAQELKLDPHGYALIGSSAGARMAAVVGAYGSEALGQKAHEKAAAVIMAYTGYSQVSTLDRPTYMICGNRDGIASYRVMARRADTLNKINIPAQFELAQGLPHGFGLGTGTKAQDWLKRAAEFWQQQRSAH